MGIIRFVEAAPQFEIKGQCIHVSGQDVEPHCMSVDTFRKIILLGQETLARYDYDQLPPHVRTNEPTPIRRTG